MIKLDAIDRLAILLVFVGLALFVYGVSLSPPASFNELIEGQFGEWSPGLILDGTILLVINRVIHVNERRRVISQAGSLSNEFALDAVRRCREEGWLVSGAMSGKCFDGAKLSSGDLSDARLSEVSFRFADLTFCDFTHADLNGADLRSANLSNADFRWANLTGAKLARAALHDVRLEGANLDGVDWKHASIDADIAAELGIDGSLLSRSISAQQLQLLESSFERFRQGGSTAALRFYDTLFQRSPELRPLFSDDMDRQARKFLQALTLIVSALSTPERGARSLDRLGQKHAGFGVETRHYSLVGEALIATLAQELGDDFTDEVKLAWLDAYGQISSAMIAGAE